MGGFSHASVFLPGVSLDPFYWLQEPRGVARVGRYVGLNEGFILCLFHYITALLYFALSILIFMLLRIQT